MDDCCCHCISSDAFFLISSLTRPYALQFTSLSLHPLPSLVCWYTSHSKIECYYLFVQLAHFGSVKIIPNTSTFECVIASFHLHKCGKFDDQHKRVKKCVRVDGEKMCIRSKYMEYYTWMGRDGNKFLQICTSISGYFVRFHHHFLVFTSNS